MNEQQPIVSIALLIVIGLVSYLGLNNYRIIESCRHYPYEESRNKSFYRWVSCGFVHGSVMHLLLNLFVLWQFGFIVEQVYVTKFGFIQGNIIYLIAYVVILALSCLPSYIKNRNNSSYASIGASGAISGILFIYIFYFPWNTLLLYGIIPMPALLMGILYLGYSWWAAKNTNDGTDHSAHFYGAIIGIVLSYSIDYLPNLK
ncbi:MAG: rhomboid family intramembrane serine protease [Saprospiraceae bacterium]